MNILFLAHRIPYPPDKGDKIRSFYMLKYLSARHNVYLGTLIDGNDPCDYFGVLNNFVREMIAVPLQGRQNLLKTIWTGKPFSVCHFYDIRLQNFVDSTLKTKPIDAVMCYCSSMAEYVLKSKALHGRYGRCPLLIIDYIDFDSDKWRQYAAYAMGIKKLIYTLESRLMLQYEIAIHHRFNHSIFVCEREVKSFKSRYPDLQNVHVVSNGVNYDYFNPDSALNGGGTHDYLYHQKGPMLLFTGVMDYFANEDGVLWFCHQILPFIQKEIPDVRFYIVGNRPTDRVWSLSEIDGVTVTGYVQDIREFYWAADICVTPLRIARGLQNKVIEAMATGNAVVATSNASDGIQCRDQKDIAIADDAETFAARVIELLRDDSKREMLKKNAMETVKKHYSWDENLQRLDDILTGGMRQTI